ncbi:hypothetical protein ACU61S_09830 [Klebsiella aerogenes]
MNTIRIVGIDIAKSVFQVCVWMFDDRSSIDSRLFGHIHTLN